MKYLIVVDMQNDFLTGALKNNDAVKAISYIKDKIQEFRDKGYKIIYTRDTHDENYSDTLEGSYLPVSHCIKGTQGWKISEALSPAKDDLIIDKKTFGYPYWRYSPITDGDDIYMVGTCTDICVVSNALILKTVFPDSKIHIYSKGCAGTTVENHNAALRTMKSCQCEIIDED